MSKADDIRKAQAKLATRLEGAEQADKLEAERGKLIKAIATKTVKAIVKRIGKAVAFTITYPECEVIIRSGGAGGDKSPSLGRQAGVTDWIVNGKAIGSPMVSKLLAAVYKVERAKDVYGADSPERFARKPDALERIKGAKAQVVIGGKRRDAVAFLKS